MTTEEIMALPEGTPVIVDDIIGELTFQEIPEYYPKAEALAIKYLEDYYYTDYANIVDTIEDKEINDTVTDLIDKEDNDRELKESNLTYELIHCFVRYRGEYTYGFAYNQPEDINVSPRDIGAPSLKKGEPCVCFMYPSESYTLIK